MGFSHFFVDRPIFAAVISVILTLLGAISYRALPITEFPEIAPPTVSVTSTYPGASSEVLAATVASPIEQEINGVDNMIYMVSQSIGDGTLSLDVVFKPGTDVDQAQVLVQNRVSVAVPRLPDQVQKFGVTVRKKSPDLMLVIHLISPDGTLDQQYISNYATINIKDVLTRVDGVGDTLVFGARDFAMRIWLDPAKIQARGLASDDVVSALRTNNVAVSAGAINQPPAMSPGGFQIAVQTLGRLSTIEQFGDIVVATDRDGRVTRVRDIARVELGSQDYTKNAYLDDKVATAIAIFQRPGSNALATANAVFRTMEEQAKSFPPGLSYQVAYDTTGFIRASVDEVIKTLFEAAVLVVIVIILFLQTWRAAIIPIVAIPVSLIGTFFVMQAFGFSLNNLTLFGLVLAIGIVVDDAIVVVENVERHLQQGLSPKEAAHKTMDEVGGALIAIALVLCAVFIPTAFIAGISGAFYRQFAADDHGVDGDIVLRLADAVAGAGPSAAEAAHAPAAHRLLGDGRPPGRSVLRGLQPGVRRPGERLRRLDPARGPNGGHHARALRRAHRPRLFSIPPHTIGLHPAARSRLFHHRHHLAARREPGTHRSRGPAGSRNPAFAAWRGERRDLRRLRRRDLHQRAEFRRYFRHPQAVRRTG